MNKRKCRNNQYNPVPVKDIREIVAVARENHPKTPAFLVKDKPGEAFHPISFQQFEDDINALGTAFMKMGLAGKKIAVIGENSYPWLVAYFATVNGTGVVVPLDRDLQPREVANLAKIAEISAIVYAGKYNDTVDEVMAAVPGVIYAIDMSAKEDRAGRLSYSKILELGREEIAKGNRDFIDAPIDPEEVCSILFTSGTTGVAKGVMLSHNNIASNVYNLTKFVRIAPESIGLSVLPMHHTYEMTCHILAGLYQGETVAICEGLKHIAKNLQEVHANIMLSVPLIFETMHKKVWAGAEAKGSADKMRAMVRLSRALKLYNHPDLVKKIFKPVHETTGGAVTQLVSGGAGINPKVIEDFEAMGLPMIQGYGMTENSPIIAVNRDCYSIASSVGQPLPGTEVKISNPDETGVGEIICKGPSVMKGYYKNQEETDKVLKNGWLYTGDYGYLDKDGYLYISGRKKNVIIAKNGKNIFPEELEYYLTETGYILEALVHEESSERDNDVVVKAQIYPDFEKIREEKGQMDEEQLRVFIGGLVDQVNDKLPLYKRIKRFAIRHEEFEKTTTRKIKRHSASNYIV
jgi:long-chain acyl-CoA synthetase